MLWAHCYELEQSIMRELASKTACLPLYTFEDIYPCIKNSPARHRNGVMKKLLELREKSPSAAISEICFNIKPQTLRAPSQRLLNNYNGVKHVNFGILYKFKYILLFI